MSKYQQNLQLSGRLTESPLQILAFVGDSMGRPYKVLIVNL